MQKIPTRHVKIPTNINKACKIYQQIPRRYVKIPTNINKACKKYQQIPTMHVKIPINITFLSQFEEMCSLKANIVGKKVLWILH